jgi:hypothetical protein
MGRKSSLKAQTRSSAPSSPAGSTDGPSTPPSGLRRGTLTVFVTAVVLLTAVVGGFAYVKTLRGQSGAPGTEGATTAAQAAATSSAALPAEDAPPTAALKPHPQQNLPPLPFQAYAPPRPPEVVAAAYRFAAEHPEILSYVPCFCGCERGGHKANEDCFVAARNADGDVTQWEPHGLDCAVCLDVANEARQMYSSGASVRDIRAAIEQKWAGHAPSHTPTPRPPAAK